MHCRRRPHGLIMGGGSGSFLVPAAALSGLLVLTGCTPAPVSVEQAERICMAETDRNYRPRTQITMGVSAGSHGVRPRAGVAVGLSSDMITQRDPAESYARCVLRRSGQIPVRSYHDWLGISP